MIDSHSLCLILVMAVGTYALRGVAFVLFQKKTPDAILYLGEVLPYSIMAMLVVYCLKDVSFTSLPYGLPELSCIILVALIHKWKHNTLLSMVVGTCCYMFLVQGIL